MLMRSWPGTSCHGDADSNMLFMPAALSPLVVLHVAERLALSFDDAKAGFLDVLVLAQRL
jgi:hypothetical protein